MNHAILNRKAFALPWLTLWLFIACVPTEAASHGTAAEMLRILAWALIWIPLVIVSGIRLRRMMLLCGSLMSSYVLLLNLSPFNFTAVLTISSIFNGIMIAAMCSRTEWQEQFVRAIDTVLLLWSALLIAQVLAYMIAGTIVPFHSILFPWSHPRIHDVMGTSLYRFTGPHIEPGTYANWTYGLVLLRVMLSKKLVSLPTIIAMATVPLTLSVWGVMCTLFYVCSLVLFARSLGKVASAAVALGIFALLGWYLVGDHLDVVLTYFDARAQLQSASGISKLDAYVAVYDAIAHHLFYGTNFADVYCATCLSPQDAGIGLNLLVYLGMPVAFTLFLIVARQAHRLCGGSALIFIVPLFFAKFYIWEPIFWLIVAYCLSLAFAHRRARQSAAHGSPNPTTSRQVTREVT